MTTTIEWTDETWNPITGCSMHSPGCTHCYALVEHAMRHKAFLNGRKMPAQYSQPFEVVQCHPERLDYPLHWQAPRMCFVNSGADLFHKDVPEEFLDRIFAVLALADWHIFQALTKREDRMLEYLSRMQERAVPISLAITRNPWWNHPVNRIGAVETIEERIAAGPLPNFWPGVSVESKKYLRRLDALRQVPAAVRMVSFEPLLEDLDYVDLDGIGWAVIGGESGKDARYTHVRWICHLLAQCDAAGVPAFVKQMGAKPVERAGFLDNSWPKRTRRGPAALTPGGGGLRIFLEDSKGGDPKEWPEDLRRREFPSPSAVSRQLSARTGDRMKIVSLVSLLFLLCALLRTQPNADEMKQGIDALLGTQPNADEVRQGHVRLMCWEDAGQFSVAVKAPRGIDADRAIVEIGYRTQLAGSKQELFLVKVSAIELVPEVWVGADTVPVAKNQVARVDVTLVKDVERQRFLMGKTK